jgi:hypothetical protein
VGSAVAEVHSLVAASAAFGGIVQPETDAATYQLNVTEVE